MLLELRGRSFPVVRFALQRFRKLLSYQLCTLYKFNRPSSLQFWQRYKKICRKTLVASQEIFLAKAVSHPVLRTILTSQFIRFNSKVKIFLQETFINSKFTKKK